MTTTEKFLMALGFNPVMDSSGFGMTGHGLFIDRSIYNSRKRLSKKFKRMIFSILNQNHEKA